MVFFDSVNELVQAAEWEKKTIAEITMAQTALDMNLTEEEVYARMASQYEVMRESAHSEEKDLKSLSGLTGGWAYKMKEHTESGKALSGNYMAKLIQYALAVSERNACMGRIVAAPTAGSCGILPGCLVALQECFNLTDKQMVMGLFTASAFGMVIAKNASISGAECGCQAECGSASAMASAAMVEIMNGSPIQAASAAAQTLKGLMGLVCDPVAGLVEEPCIIRNPISAAVAVVAAETALAGIESLIPCDEVIETMNRVGKVMPSTLRETAEGGIAVTETGKKLSEDVLDKN